jgi:hypothetical protein
MDAGIGLRLVYVRYTVCKITRDNMDLLSFVFERVSNLCFTNVEDNEGQYVLS